MTSSPPMFKFAAGIRPYRSKILPFPRDTFLRNNLNIRLKFPLAHWQEHGDVLRTETGSLIATAKTWDGDHALKSQGLSLHDHVETVERKTVVVKGFEKGATTDEAGDFPLFGKGKGAMRPEDQVPRPSAFNGTIDIPTGDPTEADLLYYHEKAIAAQRHIPTVDKIEINVFVDGSFHPGTSDRGFAVVFQRFVLGSTTRQEVVQIAFQMKPGINSLVAEAAAMAEGLVRAKPAIVATVTALLEENPGPSTLERIKRRPIVVRIFSDCLNNLRNLRNADWQSSDRCRTELLERCAVESHRLDIIPQFPGLPVVVDLTWAPSHRIDYPIKLHIVADERAEDARRNGSFVAIGTLESISINQSVIGPLGQLFPQAAGERERSKKRKHSLEDEEDEEAEDAVQSSTKQAAHARKHPFRKGMKKWNQEKS
ncbi:hypothetical protein QBC39DRAFT_411334 [Podospora conica]|nr:hypothetical protein QBC39DRAFT_411334 [Schizothecium conicum]